MHACRPVDEQVPHIWIQACIGYTPKWSKNLEFNTADKIDAGIVR